MNDFELIDLRQRDLRILIEKLAWENRRNKRKINLLTKLRKTMLIEVNEAAEKIGVKRQAYSLKERGLKEFTLSEAYTLSRMLDISLEEFYLAITTYE